MPYFLSVLNVNIQAFVYALHVNAIVSNVNVWCIFVICGLYKQN